MFTFAVEGPTTLEIKNSKKNNSLAVLAIEKPSTRFLFPKPKPFEVADKESSRSLTCWKDVNQKKRERQSQFMVPGVIDVHALFGPWERVSMMDDNALNSQGLLTSKAEKLYSRFN